MTSVPGYCIPRGVTMQKVSIYPYFYPKNSQKGEWIGFFQAKRAKYFMLYD